MTAEEYKVFSEFVMNGLQTLIDDYSALIINQNLNFTDYPVITGLNMTNSSESKVPEFNFNCIRINKIYSINNGNGDQDNPNNNISILLDYDSIGINSSSINQEKDDKNYFYRFNNTTHHIKEFRSLINTYKAYEPKEGGAIYSIMTEGIMDYLTTSKEIIEGTINPEETPQKYAVYKDIIEYIALINSIPHNSTLANIDEIYTPSTMKI